MITSTTPLANFWDEKIRNSRLGKSMIVCLVVVQLIFGTTLLLGLFELYGFLSIMMLVSWGISLVLVFLALVKFKNEPVPMMFACIAYLVVYSQAMLFNYLVNAETLAASDPWSLRFFLGFYAFAGIAILPLAFSDNSGNWFVSIIIAVAAIFLWAIAGAIQSAIYFDMVRWTILICVCGGVLAAIVIYLVRFLRHRKVAKSHRSVKQLAMIEQNMIGGIISPLLFVLGILTVGDAFIFSQDIMVWVLSIPTVIVAILLLTAIF